jgi:flagellin
VISAQTNLAGLVGLRQYELQTQAVNRSMERSATGKRINRAKDDPAGLIAADSFAARSGAIRKQVQRLEFDSHRLAAQEGAYSVINDLLIDLGTLVVNAANTGALSDEEHAGLQVETDSIVEGIDHILQTTTFNGQKVFEGMTSANFGLDDFKEGGRPQPDRRRPRRSAGPRTIADGSGPRVTRGHRHAPERLLRTRTDPPSQ